MGLSDSFYDEDSKCPKCHRRVKQGWQTKRLESLMESWHKGDFVQYIKLENIPEEERKRKYGDDPLAPFLRRTNEYLSDAPLVLNGQVPVHASCSHCDSWLEAYAKVTNGKFDKIVEAEATREEKELVILPRTAKKIRQEFERRLSHLQESCKHERSKWTSMERTRGHGSGQTLVCQRCEKILKTENRKPGTLRPNKVPSIFDPAAKSKMTKNEAYMHLNKMRELDHQGRIRDRKAMRDASRGMDLRRAKVGTVKGWSSTDIIRKSRKSRRA